METTKTRISDLTGHIREYIETRIDIIKLDAADTGVSAASSMVSWLAISIAAFITLLMVTIGSAIGLGYLFDNFAIGFFVLAGIYLVISVIIYYNRENWISKPMLDAFVKNFYDND